jgi:hypothetical protein
MPDFIGTNESLPGIVKPRSFWVEKLRRKNNNNIDFEIDIFL